MRPPAPRRVFRGRGFPKDPAVLKNTAIIVIYMRGNHYFACSPKNFVNIFFFVFAWEFSIEKWQGIFGEFFLVSVSHETKHEKSSKNSGKIRSKIRGENSKNSGNFHSATFLT